jgi:hypothetical protein
MCRWPSAIQQEQKMSTYRTPGVYKEEIFLAPAAELRTGVPAFLGFGEKLLFSTKLEFQSELDSKSISQDLRQEFENSGISLSQDVTLSIEKEGSRWLITDKGNKQTYLIRKEREKLSVCAWIPANTPQMLTLWPQFEEKFGAPLSDGYLAYAVRGFFENDGQLCYVVHLDDTILPELALREGLDAIALLDNIDLVCAPDIMRNSAQVTALQQMILDHCDKAGDRFAILDSLPREDEKETVDQSVKRVLKQKLSGMNGALYFPWVKVPGGPAKGFVPPCGHVAGVYARSDGHVGVHKAPANEDLTGVLDLEVNLTGAQQGPLNQAGVNCLRAFPGRGLRVWGARTLAGEENAEWTYVNVRRLFLTAGRWVERTMADAVFEPNDPRLWARVERELSAYFEDLFQRGALQGASAGEAFYVKCDAETNPPGVRDLGQVVTEIGLAPAAPAEFVVVRIVHGASGVTISGPARPEQ